MATSGKLEDTPGRQTKSAVSTIVPPSRLVLRRGRSICLRGAVDQSAILAPPLRRAASRLFGQLNRVQPPPLPLCASDTPTSDLSSAVYFTRLASILPGSIRRIVDRLETT